MPAEDRETSLPGGKPDSATEQYLSRYEDMLRLEQGRSKLTVYAYLHDVREYIAYITGEHPETFDPGSISTSDIRVWLASLSRKGLQRQSVKRKLQSLRSFFVFLLRSGSIAADPTGPVELSVRKKPLPKYVPEREMEQVIETDEQSPDAGSFEGTRDRMIISLLYTTGMRRAEILSLTDSDFRMARGELRILGKGNKERIVPLAPQMLLDVKEYMRLRDERFPARSGCRFLTGNRGKDMSAAALASIVRSQLAGTSAEQRTPHVLRHTFATAMLNGGADINTVKEFLGHASIATTQIYTHVSFADLQRDYNKAHPRAHAEKPGKPPVTDHKKGKTEQSNKK